MPVRVLTARGSWHEKVKGMDEGASSSARSCGRSASDGGRIAITVDDDGPGIAEEMRPAVLQRGVRADEATPGTGLGLAIVGDLAEVYGGSIALEPSPRGGCRAVLRLPA